MEWLLQRQTAGPNSCFVDLKNNQHKTALASSNQCPRHPWVHLTCGSQSDWPEVLELCQLISKQTTHQLRANYSESNSSHSFWVFEETMWFTARQVSLESSWSHRWMKQYSRIWLPCFCNSWKEPTTKSLFLFHLVQVFFESPRREQCWNLLPILPVGYDHPVLLRFAWLRRCEWLWCCPSTHNSCHCDVLEQVCAIKILENP